MSSRQRDTEEKARRKEILRRQRGLINDVYRLHIHGRSWTYFQPITPIRDWKKVLLHVQLPVADTTSASSTSRSSAPEQGFDRRAHPIGALLPRERRFPHETIRPGPEAVPVDDGFAVAFDQRDGVSVPRIGLVVQAKTNFYDKLRSDIQASTPSKVTERLLRREATPTRSRSHRTASTSTRSSRNWQTQRERNESSRACPPAGTSTATRPAEEATKRGMLHPHT